jgi:hypothetical protein
LVSCRMEITDLLAPPLIFLENTRIVTEHSVCLRYCIVNCIFKVFYCARHLQEENIFSRSHFKFEEEFISLPRIRTEKQ